jgi:phytol kinase
MSKITFEIKRKFIHILGIFYILTYYFLQKNINHKVAILTLTSFLIIILCIEYFRIIKKKKIPIIHFLWREKEKNKLGGQVYYILGIILAFTILDFQIALTVILMTIFGDMAAAIIGIKFGKHWIKGLKNKAWEGAIAELLVGTAIAYFILNSFLLAIPMALAATLAETTFQHVDDNLSIPLFAGFTGEVVKFLIK